MTWLSLQALGPDGFISDAELGIQIQPPNSPAPMTGGLPATGVGPTQCPEAGNNDHDGDDISSSEHSTDDTHNDGYDGEVSSDRSLAVVCLPGQEELLGSGATGPVFAGR